MSLKSEIAELIDWLTVLTTDGPSAPLQESLPRDDWQLVRDDLESAAKAFKEAGDLIPTAGAPVPGGGGPADDGRRWLRLQWRLPTRVSPSKPSAGSPRSVAADLAYDLSVEAQALADRAYVLGRRARPKVDKSADELAKELVSKAAVNKRLTTRVKNLEGEVELLTAKLSTPARPTGAPPADAKPKKEPAPQKPKDASGLVDSGQHSVATARDNLFNVTPAEQVVLDFAEELEVLNDLIAGWRRVSRRSA